MPSDQPPTATTPEAMSNQAIAQNLLAHGLPTESTEMLLVFMQFLANELVNRLAQGEALQDCAALMDRYARFDSLRLRAVATKLREAKARQQQAAAETSPQAMAEPVTPATAAAAEPPRPFALTTPPSPERGKRIVHLSRQQRRALLRKQLQAAVSPMTLVTLVDGKQSCHGALGSPHS